MTMKHPPKAAAAVVVFVSSLLLLLVSPARGFSRPSSTTCRHRQVAMPRSPPPRMAEDGGRQSDVDRLRAAAAKAREEYELLVEKRGGTVAATEGASSTTTSSQTKSESRSLSFEEARDIASTIDFASGDAMTQITKLDSLVESGTFASWKGAINRGTSSSMSLLVPFPVSLENLERRTDGKVTGPSLGIGGDGDVKFEDFQDLTIAVVLGSTLLGILALAVLPSNVGATFTYLFALIPIGFVGIGSVAPGIIASVIVASRGGNKEDDDARRERICRHEAGHFLCGYMCGLPVRGYDIDADSGVARVEFHPTSSSDGTGALSDADIAHLSVVAMSGSVAEIMKYGRATGGEADLIELQNCFRRSREFIGAARQQDLTRWGALTSYGIIKSNNDKYEALAKAFGEGRSLADCVSIIEGTA
jgi:hypothetical protein